MKLYNSIGPNPRIVRMFMHEKGIELPRVEIDLMGGENRQAPYLEVNPSGQCPALELDNGQNVSEVTVICDYLEEQHPELADRYQIPQACVKVRLHRSRRRVRREFEARVGRFPHRASRTQP